MYMKQIDALPICIYVAYMYMVGGNNLRVVEFPEHTNDLGAASSDRLL